MLSIFSCSDANESEIKKARNKDITDDGLPSGVFYKKKIKGFLFNGKVQYVSSVKFKEELPDKNIIIEQLGHGYHLYVDSTGKMYRKYIGTKLCGYDYHLFIQEKSKYYGKALCKDTLYLVNSNKRYLRLDSITESKGGYEILGYSTDKITLYCTDTINGIGIPFNQTYYFNKDVLKVDKRLFSTAKDTYFDKYIEKAGVLPLKTIFDYGTHEVYYQAMEIQEGVINKDLFEIDKSLPVVQIN